MHSEENKFYSLVGGVVGKFYFLFSMLSTISMYCIYNSKKYCGTFKIIKSLVRS